MRSQKEDTSLSQNGSVRGGTLPYPAFTFGDGGSCDGACGRYHKRRKSLLKISLSNYQLDFYVDNSWSWLPWNWLDGIGKSVQYGLYCITNFVWTISLYLSNATGYVVQEAYKLDFINDMADSIGKSIQTLAGVTENGFFFYGLLCWFPASHYLSGGNVCCLYGTYQTGNQQGTSRCYQLCGGVRAVRFVYCLRSRLHQEDK